MTMHIDKQAKFSLKTAYLYQHKLIQPTLYRLTSTSINK